MARCFRALPLMLLCLASCGEDGASNDRMGKGKGANPSAPASVLERTAIDAGIVTDASSVSPIGLYRNRHEAGLDSLCIVAGDDGQMDFGLQVIFGEGIECNGHGTLRPSGDKLIMNFARSACLVVATYDGDRVQLPGTLDVECSRLCSERGSLEGVSFPRVSREEAVARDARAQDKGRLCS